MRLAVQAFLPHLKGKRVLLHEDNQAVVRILAHYTTRAPALMRELRELFWLLDTNDVRLRAVYIASAANVWADRLSRMVNASQSVLTDLAFQAVEARYGPHSLEAFSTPLTSRCAQFWAEEELPDCAAVGALRQSWVGHNLLVVPPPHLLPLIARHLSEVAHGPATVVAPFWPSAVWFPQLLALPGAEWERLDRARSPRSQWRREGSPCGSGRRWWSAFQTRRQARTRPRDF